MSVAEMILVLRELLDEIRELKKLFTELANELRRLNKNLERCKRCRKT